MPCSAVSIELRAVCDACARPLPVNGLRPRVACRWCGVENPIEPQVWDHLLHDALENAVWLEEGELATVAQTHHGRAYVLTYAPAALPPKKAWRRRGEAAPGLLHGLVATAGEQLEDEPVRPSSLDARCASCGGAVPVDGSARAVPCPFCGVRLLVPDEDWARLHPAVAARRWTLVVEPGEPPEEPTWAGEAVSGPDGTLVYAATLRAGSGLVAEGPRGRPRWRRLDLGGKSPDRLRFCWSGDRIWVKGGKGALLLDPASGQTAGELDLEELRAARELVALPEGGVLAVGARCARVGADGAVRDAWDPPETLGFFARLLREPEQTGPYACRAGRLAVGLDGLVWQLAVDELGHSFLACLEPGGRRRWRRELEAVQPTDSPPQPGAGGAWVFVWGDHGARILAFDADGQPAEAPAWGRFRDGAWDGVPRFVRTPDGAVVYDTWGKVRRFGRDGARGNASAREADREEAEEA